MLIRKEEAPERKILNHKQNEKEENGFESQLLTMEPGNAQQPQGPEEGAGGVTLPTSSTSQHPHDPRPVSRPS